jgi:hypothetical protein
MPSHRQEDAMLEELSPARETTTQNQGTDYAATPWQLLYSTCVHRTEKL